MVKYIRPDLTERQLGKCVFQLKRGGESECDGRITMHELRTALQVMSDCWFSCFLEFDGAPRSVIERFMSRAPSSPKPKKKAPMQMLFDRQSKQTSPPYVPGKHSNLPQLDPCLGSLPPRRSPSGTLPRTIPPTCRVSRRSPTTRPSRQGTLSIHLLWRMQRQRRRTRRRRDSRGQWARPMPAVFLPGNWEASV